MNVNIPNPDYGKPARRKVFVACVISLLLFQLPLVEWFEPRVSVPPATIRLDNEIAYFEVNDKFGFYRYLLLKLDADKRKYLGKAFFQTARFVLLNSGEPGHHSGFRFWAHGQSAKPLRCSWHSGWVVGPHVLSGLVVDYGSRSLFCDPKTKSIRLTANAILIDAKLHTDPLASITRVVTLEELNVGFCPCGWLSSGGHGAFHASLGYKAFSAATPTDNAGWDSTSNTLGSLPFAGMSTERAFLDRGSGLPVQIPSLVGLGFHRELYTACSLEFR